MTQKALEIASFLKQLSDDLWMRFLSHYTRIQDGPSIDPIVFRDLKEVVQESQRKATGPYHKLARAVWLFQEKDPDIELAVSMLPPELGSATVPEGGVVDEAFVLGKLEKYLQSMAWVCFGSMVHAFMVGADEEAFEYGTAYFSHPAMSAAKDFPTARTLLRDMKRRKEEKTFGKWRSPLITFEEGLSEDEKIEHLIREMENIAARQMGQPGGVHLAGSPCIRALISIGDPAVSRLIDVIEHDSRLTRSVHFWRDFSPSRTVLSVREAALTAVMNILRTKVFTAASTGDNFTARGKGTAISTAKKLRLYWEKYGHLKFPERMMFLLTDENSGPAMRLEAAKNLSSVSKTDLSTSCFSFSLSSPKDKEDTLPQFENPTVAEAIYKAMLLDFDDSTSVESYLSYLCLLGDTRIGPSIAELTNKLISMKESKDDPTYIKAVIHYSHSCYILGQPEHWLKLCESVEQDNWLEITTKENLSLLIGLLTKCPEKEAERALFGMTSESHSSYKVLKRTYVPSIFDSWDRNKWCSHPFFFSFLSSALFSDKSTKKVFRLDGDSISFDSPHCSGTQGIPECLKDPKKKTKKEQVEEREGDVMARVLSSKVCGFPEYHVMMDDKTKEKRLEKIRSLFNKYYRLPLLDNYPNIRIRVANKYEKQCLLRYSFPGQVYFIVDYKILDRPATQQDVDAGDALFELQGKGRVPSEPLTLPKKGRLVCSEEDSDKDSDEKRNVVIVQQEEDEQGMVFYGVIGLNFLKVL
eukprot:CAMPEP_0174273280 /NCGR_PEP_ID=MMETSP0439-20130205/53970_1 /TAXON_ID=0 /ORGANISM="Stereomyxa ramosa, Strain Chinc5" /LENGTH=752 /DNA_ID=CAMNT_0015364321 /DNA_START=239 /DNA_END=2493 /DNA_ORIENTATION=+